MTREQIMAKRIIVAIECADQVAMATDGYVPATHETMEREEIIALFRDAYRLAKAVLGEEPTR